MEIDNPINFHIDEKTVLMNHNPGCFGDKGSRSVCVDAFILAMNEKGRVRNNCKYMNR